MEVTSHTLLTNWIIHLRCVVASIHLLVQHKILLPCLSKSPRLVFDTKYYIRLSEMVPIGHESSSCPGDNLHHDSTSDEHEATVPGPFSWGTESVPSAPSADDDENSV